MYVKIYIEGNILNETIKSAKETRIKFHFHPYEYENKNHCIEKAEGEKKRRYLVGVASGLKLDGHNERMTENAIQDLMMQANSGTVLLYPDVHGIKASEDIGILKNAKIMPNGDWYVEFALHDGEDGIGERKVETIDTLWRQINGEPPYPKALQKGFSIEGYIPEGGIIGGETDEKGQVSKRVIDKVKLDGVVLVPRPAYPTSIANAIYKALGELPYWQADIYKSKIHKSLTDRINEKKEQQNIYSAKFELQDALEEELERLMNSNKLTEMQKKSEMDILFDEYKKAYTDLLFSTSNIYSTSEQEINKELDDQNRKSKLIEALAKSAESLTKIIQQKKELVKCKVKK